jgi:hypothetical protein
MHPDAISSSPQEQVGDGLSCNREPAHARGRGGADPPVQAILLFQGGGLCRRGARRRASASAVMRTRVWTCNPCCFCRVQRACSTIAQTLASDRRSASDAVLSARARNLFFRAAAPLSGLCSPGPDVRLTSAKLASATTDRKQVRSCSSCFSRSSLEQARGRRRLRHRRERLAHAPHLVLPRSLANRLLGPSDILAFARSVARQHLARAGGL